MEVRATVGENIDLDQYGTLTDRLGRAFQRLELSAACAKCSLPALKDYLAHVVNGEVLNGEDDG